MRFEFMTRDIWEALILGVLIIGLTLVALRLYFDFSRPVPPDTLDDAPAAPNPPAKGSEPYHD